MAAAALPIRVAIAGRSVFGERHNPADEIALERR
jgi:hypothetical protein